MKPKLESVSVTINRYPKIPRPYTASIIFIMETNPNFFQRFTKTYNGKSFSDVMNQVHLFYAELIGPKSEK